MRVKVSVLRWVRTFGMAWAVASACPAVAGSRPNWAGYVRGVLEKACGLCESADVRGPVFSVRGAASDFELIPQELGRVSVRLYATADFAREIASVPPVRWTNVRIALVESEFEDVEDVIDAWSGRNGLSVGVVRQATVAEAADSLARSGCVLLALSDVRESPPGLVEVDVIGTLPCYLSVTRRNRPLCDRLANGLMRLWTEDIASVDALRTSCLGLEPPAPGRRVLAGRYLEPGYCRFLDNGTFEGANEDCVNFVAAHCGWQVEWVFAGYDRLLELLERGKIDLLPGVTLLDSRVAKFAYPHIPTGFYRLYLFAHAGSGYETGRSWNGAAIGTGPGEQSARLLASTLADLGVTCDLRFYPTTAAALTAYHRGECDMLYAVASHGLEGEVVLKSFDPVPCYICLPCGREHMREQVEAALMALADAPYDGRRRIDDRHFIVRHGHVSFSPTELEWIARRRESGRPVTVDLSPAFVPMKGWNADEGRPTGFVKVLFDVFAHRTGLTFSFLPPGDNTAAHERFVGGAAEIWCAFDGDNRGLPTYGEPIDEVTMPLFLVCRRNSGEIDPAESSVAILRWMRNELTRRVKGHRPLQIVGCDDEEEVFRMVLDGQADCTFATMPTAVEMIRRLHASEELEVRPLDGEWFFPFRLCGSASAEPELIAALRRVAGSLTREDVDSLMSATIAETVDDGMPCLFTPLGWMASVAIVLGAVGFCVWFARHCRVRYELRRALFARRDQKFKEEEHEILSLLNTVEARAESLRSPDASHEHLLTWTMDIIRNSEAIAERYRKIVRHSSENAEFEEKLQKIGGGGDISEK